MDIDLIEFYKLKKAISENDFIKFKVVSDSMHPLLKVGDIITVRKIYFEELRRFDIIVFWENNRLISHFLWAFQKGDGDNKDLYITKSLKDPTNFDIPIKENLLLGMVSAKIPLMTKLLLTYKHFTK